MAAASVATSTHSLCFEQLAKVVEIEQAVTMPGIRSVGAQLLVRDGDHTRRDSFRCRSTPQPLDLVCVSRHCRLCTYAGRSVWVWVLLGSRSQVGNNPVQIGASVPLIC